MYRNASSSVTKSQSMHLDKELGFINSSVFMQGPKEIFEFCTDEAKLSKLVANLPDDVKKLFDLQLLSAKQMTHDQYEIKWRNRPESEIKTTLNLLLKKEPSHQGTILSAEAVFKEIQEKDGSSYDLLDIFLVNMKAVLQAVESDNLTNTVL